MRTTSKFGAASAALLLSLVASDGLAAPKDWTVIGERPADSRLVERVSYADLNLASEAGQSTLDRRVRRASHRVCSPLQTGAYSFDYEDCRHEAWAGAKPQMARAIARATEIAQTGRSAIPLVAIRVIAG